ncbi:MAG: helix-hairpin-helix domain-containing protein [Acidimicrobiia bacterium]
MLPIDQTPPRPPGRGPAAFVEALRDRLSDPRVRVGALLIVAAVVGYGFYQVGQDQSASALPGESPAPAPSMRAIGTTTTTRPAVLVHVAGAVVRPGLVRVPAGSRVADAIAAAGGGVPEADLDRLNLAAKVVDGQRIPVAKIGEPAVPAAGGGDATVPEAAGGSGPVDLNAATPAQLDTLPGVGPSLAAAIIAERERRGGFTSVDQLRDVRGIGDKRFADLKPLVSV